ncbi:hypothetical protein GQ607_017835, partial [Colletotrichum asianum]
MLDTGGIPDAQSLCASVVCLALDRLGRRRGRDTSLAADRMQYDGRLRDTWRRFGHIETGPPSTNLLRLQTKVKPPCQVSVAWADQVRASCGSAVPTIPWSGLVLSDFAFTGPPDGWAVDGWFVRASSLLLEDSAVVEGGKQTWDNNQDGDRISR